MNKLIKRITLCVAMLMAVCVVSVATSTEAKAYETITVKQTAAATSASISWSPVSGAAFYVVANSSGSIEQTTGTTTTITGLAVGDATQIQIVAYDSYRSLIAKSSVFTVVTKPVLSDVILYKWEASTSTPNFIFDYSKNAYKPSGIEVEVKNAKKKVIKVLDVVPSTYGNVLSGLSGIKNASFIMRARPYFLANGVKVYGDWTKAEAYVAQPKVTGKSNKNWYYRTRTISLKWPKIKGAKSYSVYRSTKKDGKYKKVGTTTSTKFSQSVNYNSSYYYYVKAEKVNVGGKKKSTTLGKIHNLAVSY